MAKVKIDWRKVWSTYEHRCRGDSLLHNRKLIQRIINAQLAGKKRKVKR